MFNSITQCIRAIEKTVSSSGLTMRDIGEDVEKYIIARESYIIELKLYIYPEIYCVLKRGRACALPQGKNLA